MLNFLNRKFTYEVLAQRQKRWQIETVCDSEDQAIGVARKILTSGKAEAARIVQYRTMPVTGYTTSKVVFEELAPAQSEKPIMVNDPKGDVVYVCGSVDDLFQPASRRMMAIVMRDYFIRVQITPTELLHGWTHVKKLQDNGSILMSATHRGGSAQARAIGVETKDRVNRLTRIVEEAMQRARDFAAERKKLPHFDGTDIGEYSVKLRELVGPEQHVYVFRSMLTAWIFDQRGLAAKLDTLLDLASDTLEWPTMEEIDGVISDIVSFSEVIQDLFGAQPSLGRFLVVMADLLNGRDEALAGVRNPSLKAIALRLRAGRLPQTRDVLMERLVREIAAVEKPLDKSDPGSDMKLIDHLVEHLKDGTGAMLGGEKVEKALAARRLKQRQQLLRQMGMHAVAENLRPDQV